MAIHSILHRFQILMGLKNFQYDNMSMDLMIQMGLMHVLINRLEISTKDLKESHNEEKRNEFMKGRDDDDDIEMIFPKRIKMEFSPPRYIPVS